VYGQEVDAVNSSVTASSLEVTANGADATTLTMEVRDDGDQPISGLSESDFDFNGTGDAVGDNFTETETDGVYTIEFTNETVEAITIQVDVQGVNIGTTDEISFVEQVVDGGNSTVEADPTEVLADGTSSSAITVTARDSDGVPIEGVDVSLAQGGGNSEINPASATTDIDGEAGFTVTNTTAESVSYTATAGEEAVEQTATVDFTPVAPVAEEADQITTTEFVANWGEVSGATDYLLDVSTQPDFEGGMILTDVSTGDVTSHTVSGLEPETEYHYRVRAEAPTGISDNSNVIAVTTLAEIFPAFAGAEVTSDEPAQLRVSFDSGVEAVSDAGFTLDAGDLDITDFVGVEDDDTVVLTLNRDVNSGDDLSGSLSYDAAEGNVVSADDGSDAQSFTDENVANNVEGFIVADPDDQTAGEAFSLNISDAQDASGQALEGEVNITVTSDLDEEVHNEPRNFTEGSATVPVTLTTANTHELTVNVDGLSDDVTLNVIVNPGEIDAELSSVGATSPHVADGEDASTISIRVVEGQENPIANLEANDFDLDVGENAEVSDFTDVGDGDYTFSLTNTVAGEVTIQVTVDGTELDNSPIVEFVAGSADALAFDQQPATATAGETISPAVTVRIEDEFGNLVDDADDEITLAIANNPSGGDATLSGETSVHAIDGVATFEVLSIDVAAEGYTLGAASGVLTQAESEPFDITAGDAAVLAITPQEHEVTAGERVPFELERFDENDNPVSDGVLTIDLSTVSTTGEFFSGDAGGDPIAQIAIEDGQSTVTLWYTDTDASVTTPYDLTFDGGDDELTQTAQITAVTPADPAILTLSADPTDPVAGETTTLTALVTDEFDNPVPGEEVNFSILSGEGEFDGTFTGVATDAGGQVRLGERRLRLGGGVVVAPIGAGSLLRIAGRLTSGLGCGICRGGCLWPQPFRFRALSAAGRNRQRRHHHAGQRTLHERRAGRHRFTSGSPCKQRHTLTPQPVIMNTSCPYWPINLHDHR
jgi:adhesin/invasin